MTGCFIREAIVLSGTGTDGTSSLMDRHDLGGLVLAQSIETAKFDGMPTQRD